MLPQVLVHPELLVGKRIQHSVREEGSEEVNWQAGKVISIDKVNQNSKRTTSIVKYDDEPDQNWSFPLIVDFAKGDVTITS